jgi:D-psicose/D-tagatose/L-ribulose 3-epimerase
MHFGFCGNVEDWDAAQAAGFDYLELPLSVLVTLPEAAWEAVKQQGFSHHLPVYSCNLFYPKTMNLYTVSETDYEAYLRQAFGRMEQLGARMAVFGSGGSRRFPLLMKENDARSLLANRMQTASEIAGDYHVQIAIEPLFHGETNAVTTVKDAVQFATMVDRPNFGIAPDIYHMMCEQEPWEDLDGAGTLVTHAHIATRGERRFPTTMDQDINAFLSHLERIGFRGAISIDAKTDALLQDGKAALSVLRGFSFSH